MPVNYMVESWIIKLDPVHLRSTFGPKPGRRFPPDVRPVLESIYPVFEPVVGNLVEEGLKTFRGSPDDEGLATPPVIETVPPRQDHPKLMEV